MLPTHEQPTYDPRHKTINLTFFVGNITFLSHPPSYYRKPFKTMPPEKSADMHRKLASCEGRLHTSTIVFPRTGICCQQEANVFLDFGNQPLARHTPDTHKDDESP
ncbi:hypothetical protein KCN56_09040 [Photobacterium galatheae]|uniref:hypothetical protein n=1 Tax=Photobacterium galatheae TaxID=1654360 RepID=UPI00202CBE32|nr:hypothetical protein [Photobacterium galatheae]MCM0148703.1 hypothetical protein [Photobacterium galatheae]